MSESHEFFKPVSQKYLSRGPPFPPWLAGVSPSLRNEAPWEATLFAKSRPALGGPGDGSQTELEAMVFSHESRDPLKGASILEQPRANGWESHIGLHFYY